MGRVREALVRFLPSALLSSITAISQRFFSYRTERVNSLSDDGDRPAPRIDGVVASEYRLVIDEVQRFI